MLIYHEYRVHSDLDAPREFILVCPGFQFEGSK